MGEYTGGNTNTNTSSDTGNSTTNNDWVAKELAKARAEYKAASAKSKGMSSTETVKAGAKIGALRDGVVYWSKTKLKQYKDSNSANIKKYNNQAEAARKEYKEIESILNKNPNNVPGFRGVVNKYIKEYEKENKGESAYGQWVGGMNSGFKKWLEEKRKKAGQKLDKAKEKAREYRGYYYQCEYAEKYIAEHGQPTAKVTKNEVVNDTNGGGSDGVGVGSGASDGNTDGTGVGGAGAGGGTGPAANGTPAYSEGDPYKDKDGNMVTPLKDANGNVVGYKFKDKEGKDQVLMNDDIKKTKVSLDDVKKALEDGDIKKALELLLQALLGKQQSDMQKAQTGNTADGNVGSGTGTTGATPTPEITSKDYIEERTGVKFTVTKQGDNIQSISQTAQGNIEAFTAEHFAKASIEPKDVEAHLQKGEFTKADELLAKVAAANGKLAARVDVNGNDIVLMDCYGKAFTLNKKKLEEFGLKKGKAETAMENLRALAKSGQTNQSAAYIVASYFAKEKPAPTMPATQATYGSPKLNRNPGGKIISISVKDASGNEKELGYKDFADALKCSKEEAKKIRKECIRVIKNNGNVNEVLSFVAANSEGKSKFWTKTATKIGTYALVAAGGYFAGRAIFKGHGSSDGDSSDSTETNSTEAKSTEILTAAKTTNSNGETPVTPATPASPYTGTTWLDRNKGRGY